MAELRAVPDLPHRFADQSSSPILSEAVGTRSWDVQGELYPGSPEWQERALCAQTDPEAFFPE
jgi:hypothetical protein